MAVFPLPRAPSRRVAGNKLDFSFKLVRPCLLGAISCLLVVVAAADRAAVTCLGAVLIPPHLVHFVEIEILLFLAARYVMWGNGVSSVSLRLTAPSAEGAFDGAS